MAWTTPIWTVGLEIRTLTAPIACSASYIYDFPFFKNSTSRFLRGGLAGWQLSGISSFFSGLPVDFNCGGTGLASGIGLGHALQYHWSAEDPKRRR